MKEIREVDLHMVNGGLLPASVAALFVAMAATGLYLDGKMQQDACNGIAINEDKDEWPCKRKGQVKYKYEREHSQHGRF